MEMFIFFVLSVSYLPDVVSFVFNADTAASTNVSTVDDIKYLHALLADERSERLHLQNEVDGQRNEIDDLKSTIQSIQKGLEHSSTGGTNQRPNVAFSAQFMHDFVRVSSGHVIVFDTVNLNIGNAYDVRHGIFKAPYNGTYIFSMTLANPGNNGGWFFMKKNSVTIEYVYSGLNAHWDTGSVTTVVYAAEGDDVWIEGDGFVKGGGGDSLHTSFSGVLINTV